MKKCKCGNKTFRKNRLCDDCNSAAWKQWEIDEADNLKTIDRLISEGHSRHCACRQVWGDGECECDMYQYGYDPYAWMKGAGAGTGAGIRSAINAYALLEIVENKDYRYMWE